MISVIKGKVKFFLVDDRKQNIKRLNYILDENKNFKKIIIPKNIWYAFKGMGNEKSILFNFLSVEHRNTKIINKYYKI